MLLAVISSFVLAELGDKTMLATVALASDHNWAGVWIGATAGMVLADGVAIAVGAVLHKRLPERRPAPHWRPCMFLLFGLWMLFDGALGWRWLAIAITGSVAAVALTVGLVGFLRVGAAPTWHPGCRWNRRPSGADPPLAIPGWVPTRSSSGGDP